MSIYGTVFPKYVVKKNARSSLSFSPHTRSASFTLFRNLTCATDPKLLCHRVLLCKPFLLSCGCVLTVFRHAGCARKVPNDSCVCVCAGKQAHASVVTVFKDPSASEEMETVQKNECKLFNNNGVIVQCFFLL